jgi:hypothetical protein
MRSRQLGIVLGSLVALSLAGCANSTSQTPQGWTPPAGVALPFKARVAVEPDPNMPSLQMAGNDWTYPDSQLMQQAALNVFHRVFSDAGPAASVQDPAITIVLKGTSSLNPTLAEYYANATATFFSGANTYSAPIAVLQGSGRASQPDYVRSGFLMAYEAAFAQLASQMLADPNLVSRLRGATRP